jgi:hypothetical protein
VKKIILILVLVMFSGCGNSQVVNGEVKECYGLIDKQEIRDPNIKYKVVKGNVAWGVIGFSTIILPVWLFGWELYCPESEE